MSAVPFRKPAFADLKSWFPAFGITAVLWWLSGNKISLRENAMAAILLLLPWLAYHRWQRGGTTRIPLFALIAMAYWAAFAMPLFLASPAHDPQTGVPFDESIVFGVLAMTVLGVSALGLGMKTPLRLFRPSRLPDISGDTRAWRYLYCALALATLGSTRLDDAAEAAGSAGRQLVLTLCTVLPIAICAMLAIRRADGKATPSQRLALGIFVVVRIVVGIAGGWLGSVVGMGVILGLAYIYRYRKLPLRMIVIIVPVVLFLQTGKSAFRDAYWTGKQTGGVVDKAQFWSRASYNEWSGVFGGRRRVGGPGSDSTHALFSESIDRLALLPQGANVLARTPRDVPFQSGASYKFLAATLVPRVVWPDKPSVSDANQFYQVAYGLTDKDNLNSVSISVGCLIEAFMNFGWPGVALIMFFIGLIVGIFERTLLAADSGLLFCGLGLAMVSGLLAVESQAAQYLGGQLQQIALVFIVFLPVVRRRNSLQRPDAALAGTT